MKKRLFISIVASVIFNAGCVTNLSIPDPNIEANYTPFVYDTAANSVNEATNELISHLSLTNDRNILSRLSIYGLTSKVDFTKDKYSYLCLHISGRQNESYDLNKFHFNKDNGYIAYIPQNWDSYYGSDLFFIINPKNKKFAKTSIGVTGDERQDFINHVNVDYKPIELITLSGNNWISFNNNNNNSQIIWEAFSVNVPLYIAVYQTYNVEFKNKGEKFEDIDILVILATAENCNDLISAITDIKLFKNGYSIIDGYNKAGYDESGYDRDGFNKQGWSSPAGYTERIIEVIGDGPAEKAGLSKNDSIVRMNSSYFTKKNDLSVLTSRYRPGDTVTVETVNDSQEFKTFRIQLTAKPNDETKAFIGVTYQHQPFATIARNKVGGLWTGRIINGRSGYGVYTDPENNVYTGKYRDDMLTGIAVKDFNDKRKYVGNYRDNKEDGIGVLIKADGSLTRQQWVNGELKAEKPILYSIKSSKRTWLYLGETGLNGLADGTGDALSMDGAAYIQGGHFVKGVLTKGTMIFMDGRSLSGTFNDENMINGRIAYPDKSYYQGSLEDNLPSGMGDMVTADGTKYHGEFKNGKFEGKGTISQPTGEKYEGEFVAGQPQGSGIYFNGDIVERCEYYNGKRIDQAYLIRKENEKQLQALREERMRIAKEKADKAEQERLAAEQAAAETAAANQKSADRLLGSLLVGAFTTGLSGAVGLDTGTAISLGANAMKDVYAGDENMGSLKQAAQAAAPAQSGNTVAVGGQNSVNKPAIQAKPNLLLDSKFSGWERLKDRDYQFYSQCASADRYYSEYLTAIKNNETLQKCNGIYEMHKICITNAENMMRSWGNGDDDMSTVMKRLSRLGSPELKVQSPTVPANNNAGDDSEVKPVDMH